MVDDDACRGRYAAECLKRAEQVGITGILDPQAGTI